MVGKKTFRIIKRENRSVKVQELPNVIFTPDLINRGVYVQQLPNVIYTPDLENRGI